MSRPASRKGKAKKGKGPKKLTPKQQIAELTEQNMKLTDELVNLKTEHDFHKQKLEVILTKLGKGMKNKKDYGVKENTEILQIPTEAWLDFIGKMLVKKELQEMSVEARVEELETRVTEMSMNIAKMTKKTLAYESGLDVLARSNCIEEMKDKVYELQLIAGHEYHTFSANDPIKPPVQLYQDTGEIPDPVTKRMLESAQQLNLTPPLKKFCGETHIKLMHRDLRLYIMKELSMEKASGADWRMLAERTGTPLETIQYWKSLKLEYPMGKVFAEWGESQYASVRLLHRHLVSPQMRCTVLGKRIADFYDVS